MTVKQWLLRAKNIDAEIKALKEQKEILFNDLIKITSATDVERVSGGSLNKREEKYVKYIDLCDKIDEQITYLSDVKSEIINAICSIENSTYKTLLYERYINYKKWYQIANEIKYSEIHTKRTLHRKALECIKIKNDTL